MVLLVEPVGRGLSGYRRRHRTVGLAVAVIDAQLPIGLRISHDVVVLACHRCDRSADFCCEETDILVGGGMLRETQQHSQVTK